MKTMKRLIVGMSGASDAIYGIRALEGLRGAKDIKADNQALRRYPHGCAQMLLV